MSTAAILKRFGFLVLLGLAMQSVSLKAADTVNKTTATTVRYGSAGAVAAGNAECLTGQNCIRLIVHCTTAANDASVPPRYRVEDTTADVVIRRRDPDPATFPSPTGAVVFNTGENSDSFYGDAADANPMAHCNASNPRNGCADGIIQDALNAGRRTFETKWLDTTRGTAIPSTATRRLSAGVPMAEGEGIFRGVEGYGQKAAMCGVSEVAEWLVKNAVPVNRVTGHYQRIAETGASNGGVQIAHALSSYNGATYIKAAIFSSSPSWGDTYAECFATPYDNGLRGNQSLTRGAHGSFGLDSVSVVMDWEPGYCAFGKERQAASRYGQAEVDKVKQTGLISYGLEPRNYATPNVYKKFILAALDTTGAKEQGLDYEEQIRSQASNKGVKPNLGADAIVTAVPDEYNHRLFALPSGRKLISAELTSHVCDFDDVP